MKKICVIGLGYIGLPTASILATKNFQVIGVDTDPKIVKIINQGKIHIVEPGLETIVMAAVSSGKLIAKSKPEKAEVFMICVPTPLNKKKKTADLLYVKRACESIVPCLEKGNLVILESTVPPKTTEELVVPILRKSKLQIGNEIFVSYCPERVLPGKILAELIENDRIVGGINQTSAEKAKEIYSTFIDGKIYLTDTTTAEMVKLVENSYRDTNIAYANELYKICDTLQIDPWKVIEFANKHPRVNILKPGPGVGGHCIAVDPWFIVEKAIDEAKLIKTSREVNDLMPQYVVQKIENTVKHIKNPIIGCLGITYKADIDDIRESPALEIVNLLKRKGYNVNVCDPMVKSTKDIKLSSFEDIIKNAHCIVILVDHQQFKLIPQQKKKELIGTKIILDFKKCWL